jgi:hypothetical protein
LVVDINNNNKFVLIRLEKQYLINNLLENRLLFNSELVFILLFFLSLILIILDRASNSSPLDYY